MSSLLCPSSFARRIRGICHSLPLFFLLLLLSGCRFSEGAGCTPSPVPTSAPSDTTLQSALLCADNFSDFSSLLFRELAASDCLSLHYTVLRPEDFSIRRPSALFGSYGTAAQEASATETRQLLTALHAFSRGELSENERFLYDLLEDLLQTSLLSEQYPLYLSPLGPTTGLQAQLPVLLAEYRFTTLTDIEDYFLLLSDLPRLFSELAAYEQERAAAGFLPCAQVLASIRDQCEAFLSQPEQNPLIVSFPDRLSSLPELTPVQEAELCMQNQKLVFTCVLPAYEALSETLSSLSDPAVSPAGLCAFPEGAACYEALVRRLTGSSRTLDELEELLTSCLFDSMLTILNLSRDKALQTELANYLEYGFTHRTGAPDPEESARLLADLKEKLSTDFPVPAKVSCRVSLVSPSLSGFLSPALYLVPPIDGYEDNVIYLNPEKCTRSSLVSTLAHEGYPGHLYQNTYFAATRPHPLRMLLSYTGYSEGWATYAEIFSYRYAQGSSALKEFLAAEQLAGLCLYSLSDLKLHYRGESREEILKFLTDYGLSGESAAEVYVTQLAEPGIYLPYSVGYLEFMELQKEYRQLLGEDASLLPFHEFILQTGPAPFSLLHQKLSEHFRAEPRPE